MGAFDGMNQLLANRIQLMIAAAAKDGVAINPGSGFRSRSQQQKLYNDYIHGVPGQALAAPPGHSQHEFGLAMDLADGSTGHAISAGSAADRWLAAHAAEFGLIRPVGAPGEKNWEPWHVQLADDGESRGFTQGAAQMGAMAGSDVGKAMSPEERQDALLQSYMDVITGAQRDALLDTPDLSAVATPGMQDSGPEAPEPQLGTQTTTIPGQTSMGPAGFSGDVPPPGYAPPGEGVERWRPVAIKALEYTGQDPGLVDLLLMQMGSESGGNPRAINRTDSNAQRGDPSIGLMQNIGSAFPGRAKELANRGIYDGFANMVASIRYTLGRYGSLQAGWKGHGY